MDSQMLYWIIFLFHALSFNLGNLISIGPGLYDSNHTLDEATKVIYILNSCEFMHDGKLQSVNFYVASSDWLSVQIWRPIGGYPSTGKMQLVFEKRFKSNKTEGIYELKLNNVVVKSGDMLGLMKLNDTFPIPYIIHPHQSADVWYHSLLLNQQYPQIDDIISFEEIGLPYQFSIIAKFKANINYNLPKIIFPKYKLKPNDTDLGENKSDVKMNIDYKYNLSEDLNFLGNKQLNNDLNITEGKEINSEIHTTFGIHANKSLNESLAPVPGDQNQLPPNVQHTNENTDFQQVFRGIFNTSDVYKPQGYSKSTVSIRQEISVPTASTTLKPTSHMTLISKEFSKFNISKSNDKNELN